MIYKIPLPQLGLECEKKELEDCPFCQSNKLEIHNAYGMKMVLHNDEKSKCPISGYGINLLKWNIRTSENSKSVLEIDEEKLAIEIFAMIVAISE